MALNEQTVIDRIEILANGIIQIRRNRKVFDETELIGERYHRTILEPGQNISTQPARIQAICNAVWTPAVVAAYIAAKPAP